MRRMFYLCLFAVCIGLFAGCKAKKAAVVSYSDLNGEWEVAELNGAALNPEETNQELVFDVATNRLSGNAGCNRIMGQIEYNDANKNIIKFPQVATTRMMCPDMSGETALLQALKEVVRFEPVSNMKPTREVALYGMNNDKIMVIKKKSKSVDE